MSRMTLAVLGLGTMGTAMARRAIDAGFETTVWNRSADKAAPFAGTDATVAQTAASAVADADVILTMLFDADATREVIEKALPNAKLGAIWMQSATVGVQAASEFAETARRFELRFVDAPVLGTKGPAENGTLTPLIAGSDDALNDLAPLLEAISQRVVRAGDAAPAGSALKLAMNVWIASITAAIGQSLTFAEKLGLDPHLVLDALHDTATDCAYAHIKGGAMLKREFEPQFAVEGLLKDVRLARAAVPGMNQELLEVLENLFGTTADTSATRQDIAAVWRSFQSPTG